MGEKRRYMRFNIFIDAICRVKGFKKNIKVNNFSKEGLGIMGCETLSKGDDVEVQMTIPGDNVPITIQGQIAWAGSAPETPGQCRGGLKFREIKNDDKTRILEHIYQEWIVPNRNNKV